MAGLLAALLLLVALAARTHATGFVKIAEGVDRPSQMGMGSTEATPLDYVSPAEYAGPKSLLFLKQSCYKYSLDRWEYELCPFQNVTQKRINGYKTHLLGVWGYWADSGSPASGNYNRMVYGEGNGCHSDIANEKENEEIDRSTAFVKLACDRPGPIAIQRITETSYCVFNITLSIPISCSLLSGLRPHDVIV